LSEFDTVTVQSTTMAPDPSTPITEAIPQVNGVATGGLDINALDQYNDVETIDPTASIYDQTPPPPDGWHQFTVRIVKDGIDQAKRIASDQFQGALGAFQFTDRDGKLQKHLMLAIEFQVNEDGKLWNKQTIRQWPTTMKTGESTGVDTLLRVLTGQAGVGLSHKDKILKLYAAIAAEPLVMGKTRWILQATELTPVLDKSGKPKVKGSGEEKTEYKIFQYGMKSFPLDASKQWPDGTPKHRLLEEDPKEGHAARTKFEITDLRPIGQGGSK
jgi:hypothetical protein